MQAITGELHKVSTLGIEHYSYNVVSHQIHGHDNHPTTPCSLALLQPSRLLHEGSINSTGTTTISSMHPPSTRSLDTRPSGKAAAKLHHSSRDLVTEAGLSPWCCPCVGSWSGTSAASEARLSHWSSLVSCGMSWASGCSCVACATTRTAMGEFVHHARLGGGCGDSGGGNTWFSSAEGHD